MVGWHHQLHGQGFGWTPGVGDRQGCLACCSSVHIEDLLKAIAERLDELSKEPQLDDFQKGRQFAFWEVMDMIKTRHAMILELVEDIQ